MMGPQISSHTSFEGLANEYLSTSYLFSPTEFGVLTHGNYSSLNTIKKGGHPCGGKNYFKYHPDTLINLGTDETRIPNHTKVDEQTNYMKLDGTDKKLERIDNEALFHNYLSTYEEEIYKKNRLYEINKIYKGIREIIEKLSLIKIFDELTPRKSRIKKKLKKKIINNEEIKEPAEKDKLDFDKKELAFLLNLWLLFVLTNPEINRNFEFLREFLFFGKGKEL